jgi:hypothetical protein
MLEWTAAPFEATVKLVLRKCGGGEGGIVGVDVDVETRGLRLGRMWCPPHICGLDRGLEDGLGWKVMGRWSR